MELIEDKREKIPKKALLNKNLLEVAYTLLLENAFLNSSEKKIKVQLSSVKHAKNKKELTLFVLVTNQTKSKITQQQIDDILNSYDADNDKSGLRIIRQISRRMNGGFSV